MPRQGCQSILDTSTPSCSVCHIAMAKEQIHYGASCCFSCRAFFRKNSLRSKLEDCKKGGGCLISYIDRKSCTMCRYEKCERVGMKREFIAPPGEKRKRLKRAYELENGCVKPIFEADNSISNNESKQETNCDENDTITMENKIRGNTVIEKVQEVEYLTNDESSETEILDKNEIISEEAVIDENMSLLDPDTGEILTNEKFCYTSNITKGYSNILPDADYRGFENKEESICDTTDTDESSSPINTTDDMITYESDKEKNLGASCSAEHILHYIHKKFKKRCDIKVPSTMLYPYQADIQEVTVNPLEEKVELNIIARSPPKQQQNRKSVIVQRKSVIHPRFENPSKTDSKEDENINLVFSLSIHELESMYTLEEKSYLTSLVTLFDKKWNCLSLDGGTLIQTISYCHHGINENLPLDYFQSINFYLRERLLRFLFSLPEIENMSTDRQFKLMKKNIRRIRLLNQVMSVSLNDQAAETDFLFSEEDRDKLGAVGNYPLTISHLTTWAPIPNELKQNYITKMLSLSNHLLKDRNIYVMMLMILLFEDKSDPYVNNINVQYWTMLKRYLETKTEILDINMAIGELENFKMSLIK